MNENNLRTVKMDNKISLNKRQVIILYLYSHNYNDELLKKKCAPQEDMPLSLFNLAINI